MSEENNQSQVPHYEPPVAPTPQPQQYQQQQPAQQPQQYQPYPQPQQFQQVQQDPPSYQAPVAFQPQAPSTKGTNVMAILSLVFAFVFSVVGIVLGHISLSQIKKTGEEGRGLALTGLILSYVFTFGWLIFWVFYAIFIVGMIAAGFDF